MTEHEPRIDAEDGQRESLRIDTASGPGPVLDQDTAAPMPLFNENERAGREPVSSVIDPAEFAALDQRSGIELDHVPPVSDPDQPGVAARAAESHRTAPAD